MFGISFRKKIYKVPETINELTIGQFVDLKQPGLDLIEKMGIVLANNKDEFNSSRHSKKLEQDMEKVLGLLRILDSDVEQWFQTDAKVDLPETLQLAGQVLRIPKDVWPEAFGARMHAKGMLSEISKDENKATTYMIDILAHYLYVPYITSLTGCPGKYQEQRAEEFKQVVRELPLGIAIQLSNFFLYKSRSLYPSRLKYWAANLTLWKRRLVYRIYKNSGMLTR